MNDTVIAIDPGRDKCGLAVVNKQEGVLWKKVIAASQVAACVEELALAYSVTTVVVGDRTAHRAVLQVLEKLAVNGDPLFIQLVDEHRSSDEARVRYWLNHPPRGIMRLFPVTMRTPPEPVDDYVAVILAERHFRQGI